MKLRSLVVLALLVLVAAALLASCGSNSSSSENASKASSYFEPESLTLSRAARDSVIHAAAVANGQRPNSQGGTPAVTPPAPAAGGATAGGEKSEFDEGPRAGDAPVNATLAAKGKSLFTSKGCVTCHAFGRKVIGPDLKGVAAQRAERWIENQIMHPEVMIKSDPISMQLLAQYKVPMTNQKVSADEAKALIEYLKQNK